MEESQEDNDFSIFNMDNLDSNQESYNNNNNININANNNLNDHIIQKNEDNNNNSFNHNINNINIPNYSNQQINYNNNINNFNNNINNFYFNNINNNIDNQNHSYNNSNNIINNFYNNNSVSDKDKSSNKNNNYYDINSIQKNQEKNKNYININDFNEYDYEEEEKIDVQNIILREILSSFETACSDFISQEEKLKILGDIIEKEQEFLKTKIWQYKAIEQRLLIFIENLDKNQVLYTFKQLLQLKNEVEEKTSEKTMENIINILKNKDVIIYSRPIVSVVVNLLHEIKGTEKYYKQLLEFLQNNKYFFVEDERNLKFPLDLFMQYILDINIFNLEVHVIGDEEKSKVIGKQLYTPPFGWTCYEFDIYLKYDNGNDSWMKMDGKEGEWAVAYHGVARNKNNTEIFKAINDIVKNNLKEGVNQQCQTYENANLDTKKQFPKCGKGVYVTPKIQTAEVYAGLLNINGKFYFTVLQFRVNPKYLRIAKGRTDYWICKGSRDGVRPYRLLIKEKPYNYKRGV